MSSDKSDISNLLVIFTVDSHALYAVKPLQQSQIMKSEQH